MNIGTLISMTIGYTPTPAWLIVPFLATMHPLSYWAVPLLADRARGLLQTGPLLPLLGLEKAPDVTVAWAAVAVAFGMTYASFYPSLLAAAVTSGYDNEEPRKRAELKSSKVHGRLMAAHANMHEDFAPVAAAVAAASICCGADNCAPVAGAAWLHVGLRCAYWALYAFNIPAVRSVAFIMGWHCTLFVFRLAIWGA